MTRDASTPADRTTDAPAPAPQTPPIPDAWNQIINSGPANRPLPAPAAPITSDASPSSAAPSAGPSPAGLTPAQIEEVKQARKLNRNIAGAGQVARWEAWCVGILGGGAVLFSLTSPGGLLLGLAMVAWCVSQLKAAQAMRTLRDDAPRWLLLNELALAAAIMLYAGWNLWWGLKHGSSITKSLVEAGADTPDIQQMVDQINKVIVIGVYGTMLVATPISQLAMGWFYWSRRKHLRRFVSETPAWIVQMQRAGGI